MTAPVASSSSASSGISVSHVAIQVKEDSGQKNGITIELKIVPTGEIFAGSFSVNDIVGSLPSPPKVDAMIIYINDAIKGRVDGKDDDYTRNNIKITATGNTVDLFLPGSATKWSGFHFNLELTKPMDLRASLLSLANQLQDSKSIEHPLELATNWVAYGHGWGTPRYYRTLVGRMVHLSGLVVGPKSPEWTQTNIITVLPDGYRPAHVHIFACNGENKFARVDVYTNGKVALTLGSGDALSLDNIVFAAA